MLIFLFLIFGKETQLKAQGGRPINGHRSTDFSNQVITTDCCPEARKILDSIMTNAPFVVEGRVLRWLPGLFYTSYLFEIEKVYKGGDRLQAGTIEIVQKKLYGPPLISLVENRWYILFAKEIDTSHIHFEYDHPMKDEYTKIMKNEVAKIDANNGIKLDFFYKGWGLEHSHASYFTEGIQPIINDRGELVGHGDSFYGFNFIHLNFKTKEELHDFLATYNLFPEDMPKADTLKTMSREEVEEARERAVKEAENVLKRAEDNLRLHKTWLEMKWKLDSIAGKKSTRNEIDDTMRDFENASDSIRNQMNYNLIREVKMLLDSNENRRKARGQLQGGTRSNANLTLSIQNVRNTGTASDRFLEFDIMVRANMANTYMYMMVLTMQYESDVSQKPFKQSIASLLPEELWITKGTLFSSNYFYTQNISNVNNKAICMGYQANDGDALPKIPTSDVLFAHVKMKINNSNNEQTTLTFLLPSDPNSHFGTYSHYNTSSIGNVSNLTEYSISFLPNKVATIPLAPTPVINSYYINTIGNTTGCAGCGDVLVIQGNHFGDKDVNSSNILSTLAFKLGDFKTTNYTTIPHYKLQENYDYISWTNTEIKIQLPSFAFEKDPSFTPYIPTSQNYPDQYPGTGTFKVITSWGKEVTSAGNINIKYVLYNTAYPVGLRLKKTPILIPKKDCINGYRFQVCAQLAADAAAINCIKKAMLDWSAALGVEVELAVDETGNPVVNPNAAWSKDNINTISYTCMGAPPDNILLGAMGVSGHSHNLKMCQQNIGLAYYTEFDIGICNNPVGFTWHKNPNTSPNSSQACFYTAFLHELGHVLHLRHVANSGELMKTVLNPGEKITLTSGAQYAKEGALRTVNLSRNASINWGGCAGDNLEVLNSSGGACAQIPLNPTNFRAVPVLPDTIKLYWNKVFNAKQYILQYSTSPTFSPVLGTKTLLQHTTSSSYSGLAQGQVYYFRIKSKNATGEATGYSQTSAKIMDILPAPTNFNVLSVTDEEMRLSWNPVNNATEYLLEYSYQTNFSSIMNSYVIPHPTTAKNITGLTPGHKYHFRVKARSSIAESPYVSVSNTVVITAIPQNVRCTYVSSSSLKIEWDKVPNTTHYTIEYSLNSNFSSIINSHTVSYNMTSRIYTGLNLGTTYYFRVRTYNMAGHSGYGTTSWIPNCFSAGNGTAGNPYQITTAAQLNCFHQYANGTSEVYFRIMSNVNITRPSGNLIIQDKAVLTVMGTLTMPTNSQIIVQNSGKLIVNGGTVKNANINVKAGCNLTLENNGILDITNRELLIDPNATFDFIYGEIKQ